MDIAEISEGITLLALRPGDRLAITVPDHYELDEVRYIRKVLKDHWPEIDPVFLQGGVELTVIRIDNE